MNDDDVDRHMVAWIINVYNCISILKINVSYIIHLFILKQIPATVHKLHNTAENAKLTSLTLLHVWLYEGSSLNSDQNLTSFR